ncbi:MAG: hypothetical protein IT428_22200 [Planctomycetaceae bacterium]|nr:hypothetical protein [Planctomycetaceae bacterium]
MRFACSAIAVLAIGLLPGCATVQVGVTNPIPGLTTVAVAPFFNLSQEPEFVADGTRVALAYYAELQKIPGFQVIPVGVVETAIKQHNLQLSNPDDALRLCDILGCDAVVVGAITDYDPYYPPRMGLQVSWYSPYEWQFEPGIPIDPQARNRIWQADIDARREARRQQALRSQRALEEAHGRSCLNRDDGSHGVSTQNGNPKDCAPCPPGEPPCPPSISPPQAKLNGPQIRGQSPDIVHVAANAPADLSQSPSTPEASLPDAKRGPWWQAELRSFGEWNTGDENASTDNPAARLDRPAMPFPMKPRTNSPYTRSFFQPRSKAGGDPFLESELNATETKPVYGPPKVSSKYETAKPAPARPKDAAAPAPQAAAEKPPSGVQRVSNEVPAPAAKRPAPTRTAQAGPPVGPPVPALPPEGPIAVVEFDPRQPLMSYTRMFDGADSAFVATLRDWLELNANRRAGGWEASLHRTQEFIQCCSHLMIVEMLTLHGGESQKRLVIKHRNYR